MPHWFVALPRLAGLDLTEIHHIHGSRNAGGCRRFLEGIRGFEVVLDEEVEKVALVEDLAVDVRVVGSEQTNLAVLLGDEFLIHRGDLDEEVLIGKVEVRGEPSSRLVSIVEFDGKRPRLVLPGDPVEVEQSGELSLAVVGELDEVGGSLKVDGQVRPPGWRESRPQGRPTLGTTAGCHLPAPAAQDRRQSRRLPGHVGTRQRVRRHCEPRRWCSRPKGA